MNENKTDSRKPLRRRDVKIPRQNLSKKWREMFRRRRRMHDPMLVLNMSIFNFAGGWDRLLNRPQVYTNVT
ncbi:MAG: hypothetical protein DME34_00200 [Verrucomicrobia bacterium]|nr:MAG: hypothetical protein DME34_00200 [Verrucomicrobiota bacterium]